MKLIRPLQFSAGLFIAVLLLTSVANAQPPGGRGQGGRGGRDGGFRPQGGGPPGGGTVSRSALLNSDDVKDELKIDEGQEVTIKAALDAYRQERDDARPDRSSFEDLSDDERTALREKMEKDRAALNEKTDELFNALLQREQITRLDQIVVQANLTVNVSGFLKSDAIRTKLTVTDEQLAKLEEAEQTARDAQAKVFEEMRGSFRGGRDGGNNDGGTDPREKIREMMQQARTKASEQAMAVLTDEQKAILEEMKGKPFELDPRSLFGGGDRRGGGGGFRGGRGGGGDRGGDGRGGRGGNGGQRRRPADDSDSTDAI